MSAWLAAGVLLLALPLLLLAVPIELAFRVQGIDAPDARITVRWLFGVVRLRRRWPVAGGGPAGGASATGRGPGGSDAGRDAADAGTDAAAPAVAEDASPWRRRDRATGVGKPGTRRNGGDVLAALRQPGLRRGALRLLRRLARAARFRQLALRLRLGLGDPADTGRLWALLGPLGAVAATVRGADIDLQPEFAEAALELDASGRLVVVPLRIAGAALAFALSPAAIRTWIAIGRSRG